MDSIVSVMTGGYKEFRIQYVWITRLNIFNSHWIHVMNNNPTMNRMFFGS